MTTSVSSVKPSHSSTATLSAALDPQMVATAKKADEFMTLSKGLINLNGILAVQLYVPNHGSMYKTSDGKEYSGFEPYAMKITYRDPKIEPIEYKYLGFQLGETDAEKGNEAAKSARDRDYVKIAAQFNAVSKRTNDKFIDIEGGLFSLTGIRDVALAESNVPDTDFKIYRIMVNYQDSQIKPVEYAYCGLGEEGIDNCLRAVEKSGGRQGLRPELDRLAKNSRDQNLKKITEALGAW